MKKLLTLIGVALVAAVIHAQVTVDVQETAVTAKALLAAESAGALMQNATMERGQIQTVLKGGKKYIVITGLATITIPVEAAGMIVTVPDNYEASDFKSGSFIKGTNGIVVTVTFAK